MGLKNIFQRILGKKRQAEALQSVLESHQIDSNQIQSIQSDSNRTQSIRSDLKSIEIEEKPSIPSPLTDFTRDSLPLGIAAGYTGRFIKDIESSLNRIETQMVTKDWFNSQFEDQTPELIILIQSIKELIKDHDLNIQKRFEAIQDSINRMENIAETAPQPIKEGLFREIESIQEQLPLTSKMKQLISIVKEAKEISYEDLGSRLNISVSALRGLLSNTIKRTSEIERYTVNNRGWVKFKS